MGRLHIILIGLMLVPALSSLESAFDDAEDTTFKISGDALTMSDKMGESFSAKLDGTVAPYKGNPQYTGVSVKMLDSRTIEESDLRGGKVVQIRRWSLSADNGHIQERKLVR